MTLPRPSKTLALLLVTLLLAAVGLSGCDNGCEQTRESYLCITFTPSQGRTLTRLTGTLTSGDRQYNFEATSSFTDLQFDLNPEATSCTLAFECTYNYYGDAFKTNETIQIDYTSQAQFLDLSCGCSVMFDIKDAQILEHQATGYDDDEPFFLGLNITDPQVRTESGTNINIIY